MLKHFSHFTHLLPLYPSLQASVSFPFLQLSLEFFRKGFFFLFIDDSNGSLNGQFFVVVLHAEQGAFVFFEGDHNLDRFRVITGFAHLFEQLLDLVARTTHHHGDGQQEQPEKAHAKAEDAEFGLPRVPRKVVQEGLKQAGRTDLGRRA